MRLLAYNTKTKPRIQMLCGVGLEHAEFDLGLRGLGVGQQLADQHLAEAALANPPPPAHLVKAGLQQIEIQPFLRGDDCSALLSGFFAARRSQRERARVEP